jgi:hypothetical protein
MLHAMPIEYERDDRRRLITLTVTEPFSFDDLVRQADRQWTEDTWEYAILYDLRATEHGAMSTELQGVAEGIRAIGSGRPRGPMGVAIPRDRRGSSAACSSPAWPPESCTWKSCSTPRRLRPGSRDMRLAVDRQTHPPDGPKA